MTEYNQHVPHRCTIQTTEMDWRNMTTEFTTRKLDTSPDPDRLKSIKAALAGFKDASGIAFRLDTGEREIEVDGQHISVMTDVHVEGRHDDGYMRGYPILAQTSLPDALWQAELFDKLHDPAIYGKRGARCFNPGLALSLTTHSDSIDLLFCLGCRYLYAFRSDDPVVIPLRLRAAYLRGIYFRLFPDQHSDADA